MKISIIKPDKTVCKNLICYNNLLLATIPDNVRALQFDTDLNIGHIEFDYVYGENPPPNETIQTLPSWVSDCLLDWDNADYNEKNPPAPTPEQLIKDCKDLAKKYLQQTDWSEVPSVLDLTNTPHLLNSEAFIAYRSIVRNYAINPVTDPVWPTQPIAEWS
jgi:hypothetical protein